MEQNEVPSFMKTYTGKRFYFPADHNNSMSINIEDIGHALSNICRFGGHCTEFYSVAQHSVLVSKLVPEEFALGGLLHDASEAYLSDVVRPAKRMLEDYSRLENMIHLMIEKRFGVKLSNREIKHADNMALYAEAMHFYEDLTDWELEGCECSETIIPLTPAKAKKLFMSRYIELSEQRDPFNMMIRSKV